MGSVIARWECPVCGFYKNGQANDGKPCRRIGCDGIVERVEYRSTNSPSQRADASGKARDG